MLFEGIYSEQWKLICNKVVNSVVILVSQFPPPWVSNRNGVAIAIDILPWSHLAILENSAAYFSSQLTSHERTTWLDDFM